MNIAQVKYDVSDVTLHGQERVGRVRITLGRRSATAWYEQCADYTGALSDVESDSAVFARYIEARSGQIEEALTERFNRRDAMFERHGNGILTLRDVA